MFDDELVWRGILEANPWWDGGQVPAGRTQSFHRDAFDPLLDALRAAEPGRGVVALGPRRVGKSVLIHQVAAALLRDGTPPDHVVLLTLDDVALRGSDLGRLLDLVQVRKPVPPGTVRWLFLDEVQHAPEWSGWLKRLADRRDPWRFLATGSSATALRRGGQDQGLGRWREISIVPWSFREHVRFRGTDRLGAKAFAHLDALDDTFRLAEPGANTTLQFPDTVQAALDEELLDYFERGGFPEVIDAEDPREARRHLRQDILDRALGRDVVDVEPVDTRSLERMFLRICSHPGGLWNTSDVATDLKLSRPTVARYLDVLERAFLVFPLRNAASPVKGQPKLYLMAPSLRAALLNLDRERLRAPEEWAIMAENVVATALHTRREAGLEVGFWRDGLEVDGVVRHPSGPVELVEVEAGAPDWRGIESAARRAFPGGAHGVNVVRDWSRCRPISRPGLASARVVHLAQWLWLWQRAYGAAVR